tara:strand:- start:824 stop:1102 length:279 start_codon:yes stop_codon:yes gene_type:complete
MKMSELWLKRLSALTIPADVREAELDEEKEFFRGPDGTKHEYEDIGDMIAIDHPDLVGKHIFEQLDAVGLRSVFDRGTTPYVLPYTFSPEED